MNSKVQAYIGFAIKKGSVLFGCDAIKASRKMPYVILYTQSLSENSLSVLKRISERVGCPLLQVDEYEILQKKNCKALAICDSSLSDAIKNHLMYMPREEK